MKKCKCFLLIASGLIFIPFFCFAQDRIDPIAAIGDPILSDVPSLTGAPSVEVIPGIKSPAVEINEPFGAGAEPVQTSVTADAPRLEHSAAPLKSPAPLSAQMRAKISAALAPVPAYPEVVLGFLDDPSVPKNLKRLIISTLGRDDFAVEDLTDSVRDALKLRKEIVAVQLSLNPVFTTFLSKSGTRSLNAELRGVPLSRLRAKFNIFLQNRPISADHHGLAMLIHELAHSRFDMFLERNIGRLSRYFPAEMIHRDPSGMFMIHEQLYALLTETYAHRTELDVLESAYSRSRFPWPVRWSSHERQYRDASVRMKVLGNYGISDPRIRAAARRRLSHILLSGEISEAPVAALIEGLHAYDLDRKVEAARQLSERPELPREAIRALAKALLVSNGRLGELLFEALRLHGAPSTRSRWRLFWWAWFGVGKGPLSTSPGPAKVL